MSVNVGRNTEGKSKSDGSKEHFDADEKVLISGSHCSTRDYLFVVLVVDRFNCRGSAEDGDQKALPERQEDYGLHG